MAHRVAFLASVARSVRLHRPWVYAPSTPEALAEYLAKHKDKRNLGFFVFSEAGELAGVVNLNEIVRGGFHNAYLGYYGFAPHDGLGYMAAGLSSAIASAFGEHKLHRLEANIQPANARSLALVKRLGFRKEGFSERYLKIGGKWRDHERWAITREDWVGRRRKK